MADLNYLNPTSLKPEIGWAPKNALAGMMYHQNEQDYRQILGQQMRLQDLGEQERRYKFEELQSGRPLRDLERDLKSTQVGAQIPLAGDVVRSEQQTKLAEDNYKRSTEYSPERVRSVLSEYTSKMDEAAFTKFQRERQAELSVVEQLKAAQKQFGDVYAIGQAKQLREQLARAGINVPPDFEDPQKWDFLYNSLMDSIKFTQEIRQARERGDQEVRARQESGKYTVEAARIAADARTKTGAGTKPPSLNNPVAALNFLEQQLAQARESGNTEEIMKFAPQYEAALGRAYDAQIRQMIAMGVLNNPMDEKVQAGRQKYIDNGMRLQGFQQRANPEGTPGSGPKPERKPLGSFD